MPVSENYLGDLVVMFRQSKIAHSKIKYNFWIHRIGSHLKGWISTFLRGHIRLDSNGSTPRFERMLPFWQRCQWPKLVWVAMAGNWDNRFLKLEFLIPDTTETTAEISESSLSDLVNPLGLHTCASYMRCLNKGSRSRVLQLQVCLSFSFHSFRGGSHTYQRKYLGLGSNDSK